MMKTQNITLAIPKDVLRKARQLAVDCHTSLSSMVTQIIVELIDQENAYLAARDRQVAILEQGMDTPMTERPAHGMHAPAHWQRNYGGHGAAV